MNIDDLIVHLEGWTERSSTRPPSTVSRMQSRPEGVVDADVVGALGEAWGFEATSVEYLPVGFGSYHWVVSDAAGERLFVTVDDLDQKRWLGATRAEVYAGLHRAFVTATVLSASGLRFVVAPLPTSAGDPVHRLSSRHALAVFPYVDGASGAFGEYATADERSAVVGLLVELHRATPSVATVAGPIDLDVPDRASLVAALADAGRPWEGGPYSEPAREAFAGQVGAVKRLLERFDDLAAAVRVRAAPLVVTHGEPHAGNVIRTADGPVLIDWDTVRLAPPERDVWMLATDTGAEVARYEEAIRRPIDEVALTLYRLSWDLADMAAIVSVLRSPHRDSEDTAKACDLLSHTLRLEEPWESLLE